jgi:hypothetical protein
MVVDDEEANAGEARIVFASPASYVVEQLGDEDKCAVQSVVEQMIETLDADHGPRLPGSNWMVRDVNDHLRVVYHQRYRPDDDEDHRGYEILAIARRGGQMWRLTDLAQY